jgi:hypothetical protein
MKIVLTLDEVRVILRANFGCREEAEVKFVHRYHDGSGEANVEDLTAIDRVEVYEPTRTQGLYAK